MDPRLRAVPYPGHLAGQPAYPNNPLFSAYVNKLQIPSLLQPAHFKEYYGFDEYQFYDIRYAGLTLKVFRPFIHREKYVAPMLTDIGHIPHILTHDAITSLYLIKKREVSTKVVHDA